MTGWSSIFRKVQVAANLAWMCSQIRIGAHKASTPESAGSEYEIWPTDIGGEKPTKLPGSQNDKIKVGWVAELPKDTLSRHFLVF